MHDCYLNIVSRLLNSYAILFCILLVGICITVRRPKLITFSVVLTLSYTLGFVSTCYVNSAGPYRYGIWAFMEFFYIFVLSVLAHYKKVRIDQVAYSSVITIILVVAFLMRMYDRASPDISFTKLFYRELLFAGNVMYVVIGYFPLFIMFYYKFIAKKDIPYSNWHE